MNDEILKIREMAGLLKINEKTAYKLAAQDKLPGFRVRGAWRFKRSYINFPKKEAVLYEAVTRYVREEMNRADQIEDGGERRRNTLGLVLLQENRDQLPPLVAARRPLDGQPMRIRPWSDAGWRRRRGWVSIFRRP